MQESNTVFNKPTTTIEVQTETPVSEPVKAPSSASETQGGTETTPEAESSREAPPEPQDRASKVFAQAKRREAQLAKREAALKEEEAAYQYVQEAFAEREKNPRAFLEKIGFTPDKVIEHLLNGNFAPDKPPTVEDRVAAIEKAREEQEARVLEAEKARLRAQADAQLEAHREAAREALKANAAKYPLLVHAAGRASTTGIDAGALIQQLIISHHADTGLLLSFDEAAELMEEDMREQHRLLFPEEGTSEPPDSQSGSASVKESNGNAPKEPKALKTLTNDMSASSPPPPSDRRTEEERTAAAIELLRKAREDHVKKYS